MKVLHLEKEGYKIVDIKTLEVEQTGLKVNELLKLEGKFYMHELTFYGAAITNYLLKNGYVSSDKLEEGTFKKIENSQGSTYSIAIRNLKIVDSSKLLNFPISKIKEDYLGNTNLEDAIALATALNDFIIKRGHTKDTLSGCAFSEWREMTFKNHKEFRKRCPELPLEIDDFIRKSYHGGICHLAEEYKDIEPVAGIVLDVNSLFSYAMHTFMLPWGTPTPIYGECKDKKKVVVQKVLIDYMILKEDKIPCILKPGINQLCDEGYIECEYNVELVLNSVDLELLKECYDYGTIEYKEGYKFNATDKLFKKYVAKYYDMKCNATNPTDRKVAKLFLNALYGKFGSKVHREKSYYILKDGVERRRFKVDEEELGTMYYTALASFITAYAKAITVRAMNANYDVAIYCDTDSAHLECSIEEVKGIEIHPKKLGAWKVEYEFTSSKYLGAKKYMEKRKDTGEWEVKCSGLPNAARESINSLNQFHYGAQFEREVVVKTENGKEYKKGKFTIKEMLF